MKYNFSIFVLIFLIPLSTFAETLMLDTTNSVELKGMLSTTELHWSSYDGNEISAYNHGGMKLHEAMLDARWKGIGHWIVLHINDVDETWPILFPGARVVMKYGEVCIESEYLLATDSGLEMRVYNLGHGANLSDKRYARTKSGKVLVVAGFKTGTISTGEEVGDFVEFELPNKFWIEKGGISE